jgi:hypothetical protein
MLPSLLPLGDWWKFARVGRRRAKFSTSVSLICGGWLPHYPRSLVSSLADSMTISQRGGLGEDAGAVQPHYGASGIRHGQQSPRIIRLLTPAKRIDGGVGEGSCRGRAWARWQQPASTSTPVTSSRPSPVLTGLAKRRPGEGEPPTAPGWLGARLSPLSRVSWLHPKPTTT